MKEFEIRSTLHLTKKEVNLLKNFAHQFIEYYVFFRTGYCAFYADLLYGKFITYETFKEYESLIKKLKPVNTYFELYFFIPGNYAVRKDYLEFLINKFDKE